ncbi:MAG TPA: RIP metalloprotease RseP [Acetobacteraceae bacterium]|nr:RIP metalloprotease RseP [Acetobacteraceae bacterium]
MDSLLHILHTVASFALVLGVLVFVHELGHYLAARWCGVHVEVFSIGFGPALKSWVDRHETEWRISALPLGGYVRMHGMTPDAEAEAAARGVPFRPDQAYTRKSVGRRSIVAFAGPAANFLLAIVLFAGLLALEGRPVPLAVVGDVQAGSAAATAGLKTGDEIRAVAGVKIADFDQLRAIVQVNAGHDLALAVHRGTQDLSLEAHILLDARSGKGLLGITSGRAETVPVGLGAALLGGFTETWDMLSQMFGGLVHIITSGAGVKDLGGPIMIADLSGRVATMGVASLVKFIALLSVNLGLVNLLPIPVLDGGHLMFYAAEALRGRPVPARAQEYGYRVGIAIIGFVFLMISFNDLQREGAFLWVRHLIG